MGNRNSFIVLIGALVAVLAQMIIAPYVVVFSGMPNFTLAFVLVVAIVRPTDSTLVLAFVLGLLFDLLGYGPLGAMSFLLVLAAFLIMQIFRALGESNIFMSVLVFVIAAFVIELLYSLLLVALGIAPGFGDAFVYRTLPTFLLDCVVGLILYPLLMRLFSQESKSTSTMANTGSPLSQSSQFKKSKRSVRKSKRYR